MSQPPLTIEQLATVIRTCAGVPCDPAEVAAMANPTFRDLDVDSLGLLGIVAELERQYGIRLESGAEELETLNELVAVVNDSVAAEV